MESFAQNYIFVQPSQMPKKTQRLVTMLPTRSVSYCILVECQQRWCAHIETIQTELYDAQHVSNDLSIAEGPMSYHDRMAFLFHLFTILKPILLFQFQLLIFVCFASFFGFEFHFHNYFVFLFIFFNFFFTFFLFISHNDKMILFFDVVDIKELFWFGNFIQLNQEWIEHFGSSSFIKILLLLYFKMIFIKGVKKVQITILYQHWFDHWEAD